MAVCTSITHCRSHNGIVLDLQYHTKFSVIVLSQSSQSFLFLWRSSSRYFCDRDTKRSRAVSGEGVQLAATSAEAAGAEEDESAAGLVSIFRCIYCAASVFEY